MGDGINGGINATLINYDEWNDFLRSTDLLDDDFTTREATLAFIWSRMLTIVRLAAPRSRTTQ